MNTNKQAPGAETPDVDEPASDANLCPNSSINVGAASGIAAGAAAGALGGPIGAAIGAIVGGMVGAVTAALVALPAPTGAAVVDSPLGPRPA